MEKIIIVGAGGLGRMTLESAMQQYECYFVDDNYKINDLVCNTKIIGSISDLEKLFKEYKNIIVAIGDNSIRESIIFKAKKIGYKIPIIINKTAYISPFSNINEGCIILSNASVQNGAYLGIGVVITANVEVHHDCYIDDFSLVYSNSTIRTGAKLCKKVKVGSNSTIKSNTIIKSNKVIKDGCVK